MKHTVKTQHRSFSILKWLPLFFVVAMSIAVVLFILENSGNENKATVVKISGDVLSYNMSKLYFLGSVKSDSVNTGALLAEKGDLLLLGETPYYFNDTKQDSLHVESKNGDSLIYINGNLNTIVIDEDKDLLPWFKQMKDTDIAALQTLVINSAIPDAYLPYFEKIAREKPHISLAVTMDDSTALSTAFTKLTVLFSPRLLVTQLHQEQLKWLTKWKEIECIYFTVQDSAVTTALPAIPSLRQVILIPDEETIINADFFQNNPQIEKITTFGYRFPYLQTLHHLTGLNLGSFDSLDVTAITKEYKDLTVLNLGGTFCLNIASLDSLKQLTWLGLPQKISQQEFDTTLLHHPGLQVLQMHSTKNIKSLYALTQLSKLNGLVIADTVIDNKTLYALNQLRYLSLPEESFKDSANILSLQKALPGCLIVPNSGACLGSGWLLLVIPLTLFFGIFLRAIANRRFLFNKHNDKTS
ncbi:hypothetical protein FRZ67_01980 [Panacibacter ginsenosidivorans]|uniref:Leucine-rich repeat domain-containing protein n=1 Tax=Panacibacter ginsenosidivorans TaxID=1813871 RepID=A0A5B8V4J4_9BACT|nr:hypothetical protein [Panacibacter ginsenosidivorans]QEC66132.1 hypothetical protein FRZ67_01980 [Panacibacter ginsenosidivorans]